MVATNLGPLTTTFSAPSSCSSQISNTYAIVDDDGQWWAQGPVDLGNCWPSGFLMQTEEYYSPGLCPSGYKPACASSTSIGSLTETAYTCCPDKFSYTCAYSGHPGWGGCYYDIPSQTSVFTSVYVIANQTTSVVSEVTNVFGAINAQSIQVRFQSSDFASTTSSSSVISTTSSTQSSGGIATNTSPAMEAPSGTLSAGAKAGIGIGVAVAVLGLVGGIVFMMLKKRKQRSNGEAQYPPPPEQQYAYYASQPKQEPASEMSGPTYHEMSNHNPAQSPYSGYSNPPSELHSDHTSPNELDGRPVAHGR